MVKYIFHKKFSGDDAIACEKKQINKEIEEIFVAESWSASHMVIILNNITNLVEVKYKWRQETIKIL